MCALQHNAAVSRPSQGAHLAARGLHLRRQGGQLSCVVASSIQVQLGQHLIGSCQQRRSCRRLACLQRQEHQAGHEGQGALFTLPPNDLLGAAAQTHQTHQKHQKRQL